MVGNSLLRNVSYLLIHLFLREVILHSTEEISDRIVFTSLIF